LGTAILNLYLCAQYHFMILTIQGYGLPVLKAVAQPVTADYAQLNDLIDNMWQTMYHAEGVGLAAPQVGLSIRLFVVDTIQLEESREGLKGIKQVFINAQMIDETGEPWAYEEGCLSIPGVRGKVMRQPGIKIRWQDQDFNNHEAVFDGMNARVIQHEYDHLQGILFTERLEPSRRLLLKNKLDGVRRGRVSVDYKIKFAEGR